VTDQDVLRLIEDMNFAEAHHALLARAVKLSAKIRNQCMLLSANRATDGSPEVFRLEALLRDVIQISGEGFYG
jgi:hypothetical protein